jgi:hypothetical protein
VSLRSPLTRRLAIAAATGALATMVTVTPAAADDGWGNDPGPGGWNNGGGNNQNNWNNGGGGNGQGNGNNNGGGNGQNNWNNGGGGNGQNNWNNGGGGNGQNNWNNGGGGNGQGNPNNNGGGGQGNANNNREDFHDHDGDNDPRFTRGIVRADTLALRSSPTRRSDIVRFVRRGEVVSIFCQFDSGENLRGNPVWYLLADGAWAWGPARLIDTRRTPREC